MKLKLLVFAALLISSTCIATVPRYLYPQWWIDQGIVDNSATYDLDPVLQGQVKHFATQACIKFEELFPGDTSELQTLTNSFSNTGNRQLLNIGQLKNTVKPFYDKLAEYGLSPELPWSENVMGAFNRNYSDDYRVATLGDVKRFFRFYLPSGDSSSFIYVATNGNDTTGTGTIGNPLASLVEAESQASFGDTIIIREGLYRHEGVFDIDLPGTPEKTNYLSIVGFNTDMPIITVAQKLTGWTVHSGDIWKKTEWSNNVQQVFHNGWNKPLDYIGNPSDTAYSGDPSWNNTWFNYIGNSIEDMYPGTVFHDRDNFIVYVWLPDGSAPPAEGLEVVYGRDHEPVSTTQIALRIQEAYTQLQRIRFIGAHAGTWATGSAVIASKSNTVVDVVVHWSDFGGMSATSHSKIINCDVSNNGCVGFSANTQSNIIWYGCVVTNNNYLDYTASWHNGGFKIIPQSQGHLIEYCRVGNNKYRGIWFDGCTYGSEDNRTVVRYNYIYGHPDDGVMLEMSDYADIYGNICVSNHTGILIAESRNCNTFNNTVLFNGEGFDKGYGAGIATRQNDRSVYGIEQYTATNTFYNNLIIYTKSNYYDLALITDGDSRAFDNKADYNLIYSPRLDGQGNPAYGYYKRQNNWHIYDLNTLTNGITGYGGHFIETHPGILFPDASDGLMPAVGSPVIGVATNYITQSINFTNLNINIDVDNRTRIVESLDIGAYEFRDSVFQQTPLVGGVSDGYILPNDNTDLVVKLNGNVNTNTLAIDLIQGGVTQAASFVIDWDNYRASVDVSALTLETTYTLLATFENNQGERDSTYTTTFSRGGVGTGTPVIDTLSDPLIVTSGDVSISGTNNNQVVGDILWVANRDGLQVGSGTFPVSGTSWSQNIGTFGDGVLYITVTATNSLAATSIDESTLDYGVTDTHYVDINSPGAVYPYSSWATAATDIQDAINASWDGNNVLVADGTYSNDYNTSTSPDGYLCNVFIDRGITLESVNGPAAAIIEANNDLLSDWNNLNSRGIYVDHSDAKILGLSITKGWVDDTGALGGGGGLHGVNFDMISNCWVYGNYGEDGGGVALRTGSGLLIDSKIYDNTANDSGGGLYAAGGYRPQNLEIYNNTSLRGGGIVADNIHIYGSLIYSNTSTTHGAGVQFGNNVYLHNSTVVDNQSLSSNEGGVSFDSVNWDGNIINILYNSIVWNNAPYDIGFVNYNEIHTHSVNDSIIGTFEDGYTDFTNKLDSLSNFLTNDPLMDVNYALLENSPAIDSGAYESWMATYTKDLAGNDRIINSVVDMGVYEASLTPPELSSIGQWFTDIDGKTAVASVGSDGSYVDSPALYVTYADYIKTGHDAVLASYDWEMSITFALYADIPDYDNILGIWQNQNGQISIHTYPGTMQIVGKDLSGTGISGLFQNHDISGTFNKFTAARVGNTITLYVNDSSVDTIDVTGMSFGTWEPGIGGNAPTGSGIAGPFSVSDAYMVVNGTTNFHYVFSEGSDTNIHDVSGSGNHGWLAETSSVWTNDTANQLESWNLNQGYRQDGSVKIPALADGSSAADGNPITSSGGVVHNGAGVSLAWESGTNTYSELISWGPLSSGNIDGVVIYTNTLVDTDAIDTWCLANNTVWTNTLGKATPLESSGTFPEPVYTEATNEYPVAFSSYNAPTTNAASSDAVIAEWTRSATPDRTVSYTSEENITNWIVFASGSTNSVTPTNHYTHGYGHFKMPAGSGFRLAWPEYNGVTGTPIRINAPDLHWVSPSWVTTSDQLVLHGQNLAVSGTGYAYIDNYGWITNSSGDQYRLVFDIPDNLPVGTYTVRGHNGTGQQYGFSDDAHTFTVGTAYDYSTETALFVTSGDFADFQSKYSSALPGTTVYVPGPATYTMTSKVIGRDGVRIYGTGATPPTFTYSSSLENLEMFDFNGTVNAFITNITIDCGTLPTDNLDGPKYAIHMNDTSNCVLTGCKITQENYSERPSNNDGQNWFTRELFFFDAVDQGPLIVDNCTFIWARRSSLLDFVIVKDCEMYGIYWDEAFIKSDGDEHTEQTEVAFCDFYNLTDGVQDQMSNGRLLTFQHNHVFFHSFFGNTSHNQKPFEGPEQGPPDQNSGEQWMNESADNQVIELVTEATANTLVGPYFASNGNDNYVISIYRGKGMGQVRRIASVNNGTSTATIDGTWNVIPDSSSVYGVQEGIYRTIVASNYFDGVPDGNNTASVGVQSYGGANDWIVANNTFHELEHGFSVFAYVSDHQTYTNGESSFFNLFTDNTIEDLVWHPVDGFGDDAMDGITVIKYGGRTSEQYNPIESVLCNTFRDIAFVGNVDTAIKVVGSNASVDIDGTVFEHMTGSVTNSFESSTGYNTHTNELNFTILQ